METICTKIFGFVETKLDCCHPLVSSTIHKQKRKVWDHCILELSSSDSTWYSAIKPGSTLLRVTGPLVGWIHCTISDDLGRWSGMECLGRDGHSLVSICAYQVPLLLAPLVNSPHILNRFLPSASAVSHPPIPVLISSMISSKSSPLIMLNLQISF